MYDPSGAIFSWPNLYFLAQASVPTCDTVLGNDPPGAADLGATWTRLFGMVHLTGIQPQASVFSNNRGDIVIVVAGIGNFTDFNEAMNGSFDLRTDSKLPGRWNAYTLVWLTNVEALLAQLPAGNFRTMAIVGHSFGGTVASALGYIFTLQRRAERVAVFSCGAPRFCDSFARDALSTVPHYRLMNYGDLVPAVPPRPTDAPLVYPVLNPRQISAWMQLVHPDGGVAVNVDGSFIPAVLPLGYATPLVGNLGNAWQLFQSSGLPAHAMQQYADRLRVIAETQGFSRVHGVQRGGGKEEMPGAGAIADVQRQARLVINQVHANQTRVPASATAGLVKVKRVQRRWFVLVNGKHFYTATSKRDARGVAHATRRMLQQYMQNPSLFTDRDAMFREADLME